MSALLAGATIAAPIVGGLVGNMMGAKDRKGQRQQMAAALAELQAVGFPPDLSKEIIFKEFERVGILTPQLEEDIQLAESEVAQIKEDPALRDKQIQALQQLQQRSQVGLSTEDRAALNQVRNEAQRDSQAKQEQILQQLQSRGMGGSGAELMALLQSAQGAADQAAAGSDAIMSTAQQRALQALSESGRMAGDVRSQDFGVESTRAQALDERNRMLAQNAMARQSSNVNRLNQAQQMNLSEQQRIADTNIQMSNAEKLRQVNEKGALFDRELGLAQAKAGARTGQAQFLGQQAQQTQNMFAGIGSGIGQGVGSYGQMQNTNEQNALNRASAEKVAATKAISDKNMKENVDYTDEDVTLWMDRISKLLKGNK
jgi:hypothetical protein